MIQLFVNAKILCVCQYSGMVNYKKTQLIYKIKTIIFSLLYEFKTYFVFYKCDKYNIVDSQVI